MKLNYPFVISSRLLPAVKVGNGTISIEFAGQTQDGRTRYRYYIDTPDFEYSGNDLKSSVGGGSLQKGMEDLLSFLNACAESRQYSRSTPRLGENSDLFPDHVGEWAGTYSEEIAMLEYELQESPELITD
ncbi:MAG: hypothetical protein KGJ13_08865 [Patescibacteria group bacterium]|nr:hypothetical protein [Patescibacteria group bacterium]